MPDRTGDPMASAMVGGPAAQNHSSLQLCGARTRQGGACRHVAMAAGKCCFHGGLSTGPRTAEGIERHREAVTRHGGRSRAAQDFRALVRQLRVDARRVIELARPVSCVRRSLARVTSTGHSVSLGYS